MKAVVFWLGLSLLVSASALSLSKARGNKHKERVRPDLIARRNAFPLSKTKGRKPKERVRPDLIARHIGPDLIDHHNGPDLIDHHIGPDLIDHHNGPDLINHHNGPDLIDHHIGHWWPPTGHNGGGYRRHCNVGIIGGGISGLYMAYEIAKVYATNKICIFEKKRYLGGRILDHYFNQAPNIAVGMGAWRIDKKQEIMINLMEELGIDYNDWTLTKPDLFKSRGMASENETKIKDVYPQLKNHPDLGNKNSLELFKYLLKEENAVHASKFPTFYSYASNFTTSEGAHFMHELSFHRGEIQDLVSPAQFLDFIKGELKLSFKYFRPLGGMSTIIKRLAKKVKKMHGKIYTNTEVLSIKKGKRRPRYILKTSKFKVEVDMVVVAIPPGPFRQIKGGIAKKIQDMPEFNSLIPIPAFKGAAVYSERWWKKVRIGENSVEIQDRQMFASHDNCLGASLVYKGTGYSNERGVLHTIYTDGHCARRWKDIQDLGKQEYIEDEVHRALESKYGVSIPKPLATSYQYWDPAWHFQKSGTMFTTEDVVEWAKRPLPGKDIFLVGEAFGPERAWCQGAIISAQHALREGWAIDPGSHGGGYYKYYKYHLHGHHDTTS